MHKNYESFAAGVKMKFLYNQFNAMALGAL